MKRLVVFLLTILTIGGMAPAAGQDFDPGFYLSQQIRSKNCPYKVNIGKGKNDYLCLTEKPIVAGTEFVSVSAMKIDSVTQGVYMDLALSVDAIRTLKAISSTMNEASLVLIIDNGVVGLFDYEGLNQMSGNFIRVSDTANSGRMTELYMEMSRIVQQNRSRRN